MDMPLWSIHDPLSNYMWFLCDALICKEDSGESHSSCILLVYEQRSTSGPHGNLMESVSDSLVRNIHISSPLVVVLWGSSSNPPFPPCTKEQILQVMILLLDWCSSTALSICHAKPYLLDVLSWRSWTSSATWMGCRCHLMLPIVTRILTKSDTRENSVRRDKQRAVVCGHHLQYCSFLGVVLLPLQCSCWHFHLHSVNTCWLPTCIHTGFCSLTGQTVKTQNHSLL